MISLDHYKRTGSMHLQQIYLAHGGTTLMANIEGEFVLCQKYTQNQANSATDYSKQDNKNVHKRDNQD